MEVEFQLFSIIRLSCDQTAPSSSRSQHHCSPLYGMCNSKLYQTVAKFSNHHGVRTQLPAAFSYIHQAGKMETELLSLQACSQPLLVKRTTWIIVRPEESHCTYQAGPTDIEPNNPNSNRRPLHMWHFSAQHRLIPTAWKAFMWAHMKVENWA